VLGLKDCKNPVAKHQRDEKGTIRPVLDIHDNTMIECLGGFDDKLSTDFVAKPVSIMPGH